MRPLFLAAACLFAWPALRASATDPTWRAMSLPPEAVQLNQQAEAATNFLSAASLYAQSIRLFPSNGPALYGLGRALLGQNRPADSLKIFRRMNTLFPGDPEILAALAAALARLPTPTRADIQEGIGLAEQSTQLQPDAPEAWHLLSVLRHLDGDYARAAEAARQAVKLDAHNPVDPETTALYQQQETACNDALLVFSPLD